MPLIPIDIVVNGNRHQIAGVPSDLSLLDFLGEELGLTGTKFCCGIGVCRACTVMLQRVAGAAPVPVLSCSTPVSEVNGQRVTTVEGLAPSPDKITPLQRAFLDEFAFQCGYCTSGFLMAAEVMLRRLRESPIRKSEVDAQIQTDCGAHICRCTGYVRYHQAIRKVILATPGLVKEG